MTRSPSHLTPALTGFKVPVLVSLVAFVYVAQVLLILSSKSDGRSDFDVFYLASQSFWSNTVGDAYHSVLRSTDGTVYRGLRWTYPPPFVVLLSPLGLLPKWIAYAVLMGLSGAAYLWVLRRICPEYFGSVLMAVLPATVVCLSSGQNGLLFAAIMGIFALLALSCRSEAGLALGLLTLKPQILPPAALSVIVLRRWRELSHTIVVTAALITLSFLTLRPAIWADFFDTMRETNSLLFEGQLPLFRMISVYACFRSWGAGGAISILAHLIVAAVALQTLAFKSHALSRRNYLGLVAFATALISPYQYDYDLPVLGIAFALLWPTIFQFGTRIERTLCVACFAFSSVWGMLYDLLLSSLFGSEAIFHHRTAPTLAGLFIVVGFLVTRRIALRATAPA